jgi:hypothetical protein
MKTAKRMTPADRTRAVARLRSMTIGTTLAGLAAVGAFGSVAALSYSGHVTGTSAGVGTSGLDGSSNGSRSSSNSATTSSGARYHRERSNASATTTTGGGQVSTGGS